MAKQNGLSGDFIYDSVTYPVTNWSVTFNGNIIETTDTSSGGWQEFIAGKKGFDISVSMLYDATKHAGDPPPILPGDSAAFELEVTEGGASWSGNCIIESVAMDHPIDGILTYNVTAKSSGQCYHPGESVS